MKKLYKRRYCAGTVGEIKNLEQDYSEMAEGGWMIDKIGLFTHRYRAAEPCKKRFFVDILPQISAFDYPENEDAQDYRQICEASGWKLAAKNKQLHVFYTDGENNAPMPIHTDNAIQAKIYLDACKKYELPLYLLIPFMLMFLLVSHINKGAEIFLSNVSLLTIIGTICLLIVFIWQTGFVIGLYIRTKKSAKNSLPLPRVNRRLAKLRNMFFLAGAVAYTACLVTGVILDVIGGMPALIMLMMLVPFLALGVGLWMRRQVDTKRRTRAGNKRLMIVAGIITMIVTSGGTGLIIYGILSSSPSLYSDSLGNRPALILNDVGVTSEQKYVLTLVRGSVAVPVEYQYAVSNQEGSVNTQVYGSISKWIASLLYDHYAGELEENFVYHDTITRDVVTLTPEEAAFWGAERGMAVHYANNNDVKLLLLNGKTILRLTAKGADMDIDTLSQAVQRLWGE